MDPEQRCCATPHVVPCYDLRSILDNLFLLKICVLSLLINL